MIATLMLALGALSAEPTVTFTAPAGYFEGRAFTVKIHVSAPEEGASIPAWLLTPAAFDLDGKALGPRETRGSIDLTAKAELSLTIDLGPAIAGSKAYTGADFKLSLAKAFQQGEPISVTRYGVASRDTDFMTVASEELGAFEVLMQTTQGELRIELWPDVAPNTVRNFLDLCHTGFYDGLIFHRVIPNFMIQGGDPQGTGSGSGPRRVAAEFSDRKHVRGVLSMARLGHDVDSATSQFFIVHASSPHLDGQYTAFGRVLEGLEAIDRIVAQPRTRGTDKPAQDQKILGAVVVTKSSRAKK